MQARSCPLSFACAEGVIDPAGYVLPSLVVWSGWPLGTRSLLASVPGIVPKIANTKALNPEKNNTLLIFSMVILRTCSWGEALHFRVVHFNLPQISAT